MVYTSICSTNPCPTAEPSQGVKASDNSAGTKKNANLVIIAERMLYSLRGLLWDPANRPV